MSILWYGWIMLKTFIKHTLAFIGFVAGVLGVEAVTGRTSDAPFLFGLAYLFVYLLWMIAERAYKDKAIMDRAVALDNEFEGNELFYFWADGETHEWQDRLAQFIREKEANGEPYDFHDISEEKAFFEGNLSFNELWSRKRRELIEQNCGVIDDAKLDEAYEIFSEENDQPYDETDNRIFSDPDTWSPLKKTIMYPLALGLGLLIAWPFIYLLSLLPIPEYAWWMFLGLLILSQIIKAR